jgi:hypothetical protein
MKRLIYAIVAVVGLAGLAKAETEGTVRIGLKQYHTGYLPKPKDNVPRSFSFSPDYIADLPESFDARTESVCVPPIRNQGSCGSCWAFARGGALETAWCLAGHPLTDLAEQDTLVNDRSAYGCNGGFMDADFEVEQGMTSEDQCPYRANDRVSCSKPKVAKATKWAMLGGSRSPSVDDLRAAIYTYKAIAVTVAAGGGFNPGRDGRITTCGSRSINHMVQLVGYRPAANGGYEFLIKNSWGTSWGDAGYAWSKQGCNKPDDPQPQPAPAEGLPYEVLAPKGQDVALQAKPVSGMSYKWTIGTLVTNGSRVYVKTTTPVDAVLAVTDASGNVTTYTVKVGVK